MAEFSKYYMELIRQLITNIGTFFKRIFEAIADFFYKDIVSYFNLFSNSIKDFSMVDWLAFVLVILINMVFILFLGIRLFQLLRRYIRFSRVEIEKDELLEEISLLNMKATELIDEKNKILAMKVSNLGLNPVEFEEDEETKASANVYSRFVKLIEVDAEYSGRMNVTLMKDTDKISLPELVERFINFSAYELKLFYNRKVIATFFAGIGTSKTIILEGISGTGKTSLPYAMGKFFNNDAAIVSVQPSWRERAELIGYLNEFTKKFNETDFLRHLYDATYRDDLSFIILDEMNLARIEYYFAEFLSIMEMPNAEDWKIEVVSGDIEGDPKHLSGGKLLVPQNVWFVGTANRDDSTFTITDKVYDRAIPIEMNTKSGYVDAPPTESIYMTYKYLESLFHDALKNITITPKTMDNLLKLDLFITSKFKITFGNRIMKQINQFIPIYVACGRPELEGLDYLVAHKILRKFEALNLSFLHTELDELIVLIERMFGKNVFIESIAMIEEYKRS